jgi:prepilin-type N-terminal cleavage/methylation domain-containing protein
MKKLKKNKGFTLIEILVVIGLIAILAAVVLIAINPARQFAQANNSQRTANVNAVLNGIGQYIADHKGELPNLPADGTEIDAGLCADLVPTYLPALPTDPDSPEKGASILCSDLDAGDTDYEISEEDGRITVCAPNAAEEDALEDPEEICVTR